MQEAILLELRRQLKFVNLFVKSCHIASIVDGEWNASGNVCIIREQNANANS